MSTAVKASVAKKLAPYIQQLGVVSDADIAVSAGCTWAEVKGYRKQMGIASDADHTVPAEIQTLYIENIRTDGGTQCRSGINEAVVAEYIDVVDRLPPVIVVDDGKDTWLVDGFHRLEAHKLANKDAIQAEVRKGTLRDAVLASLGANQSHGLRRSNEDKRRAVMVILGDSEWQKWSDRKIAEICGVTHPFVAKLRKGEEPPHVVTVTTPALKWPDDQTGRTAWVSACSDQALLSQALLVPGLDLDTASRAEKQRRRLEEIARVGSLETLISCIPRWFGDRWPSKPAFSGIEDAVLRRIEEMTTLPSREVLTTDTIGKCIGTAEEATSLLAHRGLDRDCVLLLIEIAHRHTWLSGNSWLLKESLGKDKLPPALGLSLRTILDKIEKEEEQKNKEYRERQQSTEAGAGILYDLKFISDPNELKSELAKHPVSVAIELHSHQMTAPLDAVVVARLEEAGKEMVTCPDPRCGGVQYLKDRYCYKCRFTAKSAAERWGQALSYAQSIMAMAGGFTLPEPIRTLLVSLKEREGCPMCGEDDAHARECCVPASLQFLGVS